MLTFEMFLTHKKLTPYFIEEPEAHLFPEAQCEVMNLISLLSHNFDSQFFITTHSPYLLTILNNSNVLFLVISTVSLTLNPKISAIFFSSH